MAKDNVAQSPIEGTTGLGSLDYQHKLAIAKQSSREGAIEGFKAAVVASTAALIPTLASVRLLPWAKANINPAAQALIVSTAGGMAYFIVADKTILAAARRNSFNQNANNPET